MFQISDRHFEASQFFRQRILQTPDNGLEIGQIGNVWNHAVFFLINKLNNFAIIERNSTKWIKAWFKMPIAYFFNIKYNRV